jgi:hypothetical protein
LTLPAVLVVIAAVAGVLLIHSPAAPRITAAVSYVFAPRQYGDGLVIVRRWTLSGHDGSLLTETITASSASGKALLVSFEEPIPAAIAANLLTVQFALAPSKIVNADRAVEWDLRVPTHGTIVVGYKVQVAPAGATRARLARWVNDFDALAARLATRPATVELRSLKITPRTIRITPGQTVRLTLSGMLSNGRKAPESELATTIWKTGNPAVATVSSSGKVTGRASGTTHVTARTGPVRASIVVTVTSSPASNPGIGSTTPAPPPTSAPGPTPIPSLTPTPFGAKPNELIVLPTATGSQPNVKITPAVTPGHRQPGQIATALASEPNVKIGAG